MSDDDAVGKSRERTPAIAGSVDLSRIAAVPWLQAVRAQLESALASERLAQSVLIHCAPGQGGEWLASWLAARVHCEVGDRPRPCGVCLDCRRVMLREQPDLMWISPIEESREIRIDQVREMTAELALTAHGAHRKIAILSPADKLNRNAANALLKTLEEPTPGSLIVLVTGEPSRLPATILSRCLRLTPALPDRAALIDWLRREGGSASDWAAILDVIGSQPIEALHADGAMLTALQRETVRALDDALVGRGDPVATAESWGRDAYGLRIACIESWLQQRIRACAATAAPPRAMFEVFDDVREARQWIDTPINKSLALERLLWRIQALGRTQGPLRGVARN